MNKIKWYILASVFFCLAVGITMISMKPTKAETSETTFPVDEAGIAAYVKLDSVDITDLTEALNHFRSIKEWDRTHAIGTVTVVAGYGGWRDYPHVYIGLDGWIVAYYLKDEEASRIMYWHAYSPYTPGTTTLKDAIDIMCANIGVTYSTPIKYYDFEFPEANKLTLIVEMIDYPTYNFAPYADSFSVTIPGTLYEGSYSLFTAWPTSEWHGPDIHHPIHLSVDGISVFDSPATSWERYYGYYNVSTHLEVGEPHIISVSRQKGGGVATILIYKSP